MGSEPFENGKPTSEYTRVNRVLTGYTVQVTIGDAEFMAKALEVPILRLLTDEPLYPQDDPLAIQLSELLNIPYEEAYEIRVVKAGAVNG
jgi:hypothetical protein